MKITKLKDILRRREKFSKTEANLKRQGLIVRFIAEDIGMLLLMGYLFYNNVWAGLIFFPHIFLYVRRKLNRHEIKRQEKLAAEFKDGMQSVVSALTAGYSLENSFREALDELSLTYGKNTEIYKGFSRIVHKLNLNINIEEAFDDFAGECHVEEIDSFVEVLRYAKRNGGNLIQIIKNTTFTISEKIDVKREINTIISAKQLEQNIMNYVPIGIILYMRLTSGDMFVKVYQSGAGIALMTVCLCIYFAARLIAEKIVDIHI